MIWNDVIPNSREHVFTYLVSVALYFDSNLRCEVETRCQALALNQLPSVRLETTSSSPQHLELYVSCPDPVGTSIM